MPHDDNARPESGQLKQCPGCGIAFISHHHRTKYCSRECGIKHNNDTRTLKPNVFYDCIVCGKSVEKYVSPSSVEKGNSKNRFCDRTCAGIWRRGENHPMWEGGRIVEADGYVMLHRPDHKYATSTGYVFEHRLVVEEQIGRILEPSEVVHHKNEDRSDNRPENLQLYASNQDHMADHFGKSDADVVEMFRMSKAGATQAGIAREFGLAQGSVSRILNYKRRHKPEHTS